MLDPHTGKIMIRNEQQTNDSTDNINFNQQSILKTEPQMADKDFIEKVKEEHERIL